MPEVVMRHSWRVQRPSRQDMSGQDAPRRVGSGSEALWEGRVWLGGPSEGPGVIGRPSQKCRSGQEPPRQAESGREALPKGWEWLRSPPDSRECSRVLGGSRVVVRHSQRVGRHS